MADKDFVVVSSESRGKGSGCVALHQNHVRLKTMACVFYSVENTASQRSERLVRPHDIKVEVRADLEESEDVIEHGTVLTGVYDGGFKLVGSSSQFMDHQRQLDRFRPGPENGDDTTLHQNTPG